MTSIVNQSWRSWIYSFLIICFIFLSSANDAQPQTTDISISESNKVEPIEEIEGGREENYFELTKYYSRPVGKWPNLKIGGSLEYKNLTYLLADPVISTIRNRSEIVFEANAETRITKYLRFYGQMEVTSDLPQSETDVRVIPEEGYMDLYLGRFDIRGGYQIFNWGMADLYNPTDKLVVYDYTDLIDNEKEGILAIKLGYFWRAWRFEGIWVPFPDESELPRAGSRWGISSVMPNPNFPLGPRYLNIIPTYDTSLEPSRSVKNSQFGARISTTFAGLDLEASYFYGYENVAQFEIPEIGPGIDLTNGFVPLMITPVWVKEHMIGLGGAYAIGAATLRAESALFIPEETNRNIGAADELHFIYVLGADYEFVDLILEHDLRISLEWVQEIDRVADIRPSLARPFHLSLLGQIEYRFNDDVRFILEGHFNLNDKDYVISPILKWGIIDDLLLTSRFDIIDGPRFDSLFGQWGRNDRFWVGIKYVF